jgi:hypothetical protein
MVMLFLYFHMARVEKWKVFVPVVFPFLMERKEHVQLSVFSAPPNNRVYKFMRFQFRDGLTN